MEMWYLNAKFAHVREVRGGGENGVLTRKARHGKAEFKGRTKQKEALTAWLQMLNRECSTAPHPVPGTKEELN